MVDDDDGILHCSLRAAKWFIRPSSDKSFCNNNKNVETSPCSSNPGAAIKNTKLKLPVVKIFPGNPELKITWETF